MRFSGRHGLTLIVLVAVAVAFAGCSHETLSSGVEALAVNYTPSPSGTGRYERGTMDIQTIQALPTDPASQEIYDPVLDVLLFNFVNFPTNLAATAPVAYSRIALAEGTYQITTFRITVPSLVDEDVSPTPGSCIEGVSVLNSGSVPGMPATFEFVNAPEFRFTVHPGQSVLAIKVNVPGLIAGYESAFTCQLGCGPLGAPCLTAFNPAVFRAAVLANVTFE